MVFGITSKSFIGDEKMSNRELIEAMRSYVSGMMDEAERTRAASEITNNEQMSIYCEGTIDACQTLLDGLRRMEQEFLDY